MSFFHVGDTSLGEARYYDSDGNEYWEVERIVSKKIDPVDGVLKYEVKWLGYGEEDNTLEPLENLEHVRKMVDDFEKAQIAAKKNLPNKTEKSGKELSKKKDVKDDQSKAAQLKNTRESVIEQKQSKKPTENERLLTPKVIESKKSLEGSEIGNKTNLNQNKRKPSNDEHTKKFQGNEISQVNNIKSLESKSVVQPPVVLQKDKQILKEGSDKNLNLNAQQKRAQGVTDKGPLIEQNKVGFGLTRPPPPNQNKYNPNYSNLISQDQIGQKESFKEISNGDSEFDIISRTTGISGDRVGDQRVDGDKKAPIKNTSVLGELFQPKKAASKEPDAMIIEDDDDKGNTNENIQRANSHPGNVIGGGERPMMTDKSPLNAESQPMKRKSRFQDANEVIGRPKESLLDVPKALTRRESEKPIENIEISENHLRRTASSNAEIPSQNKNVPRFQDTSEALDVPKVDKPIEKERDMNIEEDHFKNRSSRFQEVTNKEKTFERKESEKSREKEENRERERDQSEDKRAKKKNEDSRKADFVQDSKKRVDRVKRKCYSELQPPKVEEERNQSSYYEAIKESYLKHDMNKNEFLEFLCPYGNFKDDKIERISKVFWEGKASTNLDDYCFEIIWKTRSNGTHKAPTVVSWEDLLDGNPKEAAKFSFGRLTKIFSNFGTLEE